MNKTTKLEMQDDAKKLAMFDVTKGFTVAHDEELVEKKAKEFYASLLSGEYDSEWLSEKLWGEHKRDMQSYITTSSGSTAKDGYLATQLCIDRILDTYKGLRGSVRLRTKIRITGIIASLYVTKGQLRLLEFIGTKFNT